MPAWSADSVLDGADLATGRHRGGAALMLAPGSRLHGLPPLWGSPDGVRRRWCPSAAVATSDERKHRGLRAKSDPDYDACA